MSEVGQCTGGCVECIEWTLYPYRQFLSNILVTKSHKINYSSGIQIHSSGATSSLSSS